MSVSPPEQAGRRLGVVLVLAGAAFALEASLYSAAVPLLPGFVERFDLSKFEAGILSGSYAIGALPGSVLGGLLIRRAGARKVAIGGFCLMVGATVAFALAHTAVTVDVARLGQGAGAGATWAAILTWVMGAAGPARRGEAIGAAMGAAVVGTLLGPAVGTLASGAGVREVFLGVGVLAAAIGVAIVRMMPRSDAPEEPGTSFRDATRSPRLRYAFLVNLLPGAFLGTVYLLVPLRMDDLGASDHAIGATFVVAAAVAAVVSPLVGRRTDRTGPAGPLLAGLLALAGGSVLLGLMPTAATVAVAAIVTTGVVAVGFYVPAMTVLSQEAETAGVSVGMGAAMINGVFAGGEMLGTPLAAGIADVATDLTVYVLIAAVAVTGARALRTTLREVPA